MESLVASVVLLELLQLMERIEATARVVIILDSMGLILGEGHEKL